MRLTLLHPRWVGAGGPGIRNADGTPVPIRHGIGVSFDCPCPTCGAARTGDHDPDVPLRHFVSFANPLDGGPPLEALGVKWNRTGETFETLTLHPSILSRVENGGCGWHGFITDGDVTTV